MNNSSELLPIVYDRLRNFAKSRFTQNDSLFGTELVHEAYLRVSSSRTWDSQAHFFGAVRNAMRNAIIDHLRKKSTEKHGGRHQRIDVENLETVGEAVLPEIVALSDALNELAKTDERAANVVTLRFFACMTEDEVAEELQISRRTVAREWTYAKTWLRTTMDA